MVNKIGKYSIAFWNMTNVWKFQICLWNLAATARGGKCPNKINESNS